MRDDPNPILSRTLAAALGLALLAAGCRSVGASTPTSTPPGPSASTSLETPVGPSGPLTSPTPPQTETSGEAPTTPPTQPTTTPTPAPSATGISEQQAITAVLAFAPHATDLRVTQTDAVSMGPAFRVQSTEVVADVEIATGQVTMFLDNAAMPTTPNIRVSKDEALQAADAWLASHAITTSGLTPTATLLDHGSIQEYQVVFQGRVNGVRVPHRVDVSVNPASGAVYAFVLFDHAYAPPPAAKVTPEQAAADARSEEKDPGAKVTASDLAIAFDAAGTQLLVYEIDLTRTDGFYVKVQVDALTGAVTVMGRG